MFLSMLKEKRCRHFIIKKFRYMQISGQSMSVFLSGLNSFFFCKTARVNIIRRMSKHSWIEVILCEGLPVPEFYGNLVYKLKKIVGSNIFSACSLN